MAGAEAGAGRVPPAAVASRRGGDDDRVPVEWPGRGRRVGRSADGAGRHRLVRRALHHRVAVVRAPPGRPADGASAPGSRLEHGVVDGSGAADVALAPPSAGLPRRPAALRAAARAGLVERRGGGGGVGGRVGVVVDGLRRGGAGLARPVDRHGAPINRSVVGGRRRRRLRGRSPARRRRLGSFERRGPRPSRRPLSRRRVALAATVGPVRRRRRRPANGRRRPPRRLTASVLFSRQKIQVGGVCFVNLVVFAFCFESAKSRQFLARLRRIGILIGLLIQSFLPIPKNGNSNSKYGVNDPTQGQWETTVSQKQSW